MAKILTKVEKFGDIEALLRIGTSDKKSFEEVCLQKVYTKKGLTVEQGERWLDLGANVGAFTCFALSKGAQVLSIEPEPNNIKMALNNIKRNNFQERLVQGAAVTDEYPYDSVTLFLSNTRYGQWRHSIHKRKNKNNIEVKAYKFSDLLEYGDCVKMDIEGEEIGILSDFDDFDRIKKLCFEYHFDVNDDLDLYRNLMGKLSDNFNECHYASFPDDAKKHEFYPPATIVYCYK